MKILVDTHIALWSVFDSDKLSDKANKILQDENNEFYYSTVSVWELTIKNIIRPDLNIADGAVFTKCCEEVGFKNLPVFNDHVFALKTLERPEEAPKHKDPFDRLLVCQAKVEGMKFLTHDMLIPYYHEPFVIFV